MKETDKDRHSDQTSDRLVLPDRSCESQAAAHLHTTELESTAEENPHTNILLDFPPAGGTRPSLFSRAKSSFAKKTISLHSKRACAGVGNTC